MTARSKQVQRLYSLRQFAHGDFEIMEGLSNKLLNRVLKRNKPLARAYFDWIESDAFLAHYGRENGQHALNVLQQKESKWN